MTRAESKFYAVLCVILGAAFFVGSCKAYAVGDEASGPMGLLSGAACVFAWNFWTYFD